MGAFIARQPNGLLCRFSSVVDTITHYNFTEEDYLDGYTNSTFGREDAQDTLDNYMQPFDNVLERLMPRNNTEEEIRSLLIKMGYTGEWSYK